MFLIINGLISNKYFHNSNCFKTLIITKCSFSINLIILILLIELNNLLTLIELAKKRKSKFDELIILYDKASEEFDKLKVTGIIGGYIGDLV